MYQQWKLQNMIGIVCGGKLLFLFSLQGLSSAEVLLKPTFTDHGGVLPLNDCEELIALGEENGSIIEPESIDRNASPKYQVTLQIINVYERYPESCYVSTVCRLRKIITIL
jgi:hypothetical protein